MRVKFSNSALIGTVGLLATGVVGGLSSAEARQKHWFYNDYDRYENQAFYDEGPYDYDEDDGYVAYTPPRWARIQRQRQQRREFRRLQRRNQKFYSRRNRQSLYDAWQNDQGRYVKPQRKRITNTAPRKRQRQKLSYVPLPRTKPYHLIPVKPSRKPSGNKSFAHKFTFGGDSNNQQFDQRLDQRPVWKAMPDKKPISKKGIEIAKLPKPGAKTKKTKTATNYKPIRIKVIKRKSAEEIRQPRVLTKKLSSNQLSCNKAKAIVQDFGFSNVSTRTCAGTIYDFNAKRDGKPYSVKVSSLSGELKGVKKIKGGTH